MIHPYAKNVAWWIRQRIHSSWVIALQSIAFVAGVWLASVATVSLWVGIVGIVGVLAHLRNTKRYMVLVGGIGAVCVGLGYGSAIIGDQAVYAVLVGKSGIVTGSIREDPSLSASGRISLQLQEVSIGNRSLPGALLVSVSSTHALRGDIVTVKGELSEGFGSYVGTMRQATVEKIVRPEPGDIGRRVRDWFGEQVREWVKEPQASLGIGFLTGQKSALPEDLAESLKIAGLTHIVVASGYNLTILVRLSRRLFVRVSKYLSALSSSMMIVAFVAVTGLSPSMTRAGLVSGMSLLTWYYGRVFHPFVLLPFAAMLTVVFQPRYVWGDLGWQLSFSAFAGVMIVAPLLQRYFFGAKEPNTIRQILGETVAAHLVTVPIIALSFGVVSNVAVVANILVVPFVPLAMLLTFIIGVLSAVQAPFTGFIALPTEWLLSYMTSVATTLSELEWAQLPIDLPWLLWLGYAGVLISACWWMARVTKYTFSESNPII